MWRRGLRGSNSACSTLCQFQSLPLLPTTKLDPSGADFLGGWVCVHSRTLWVSLMNSPVRLGVSLAPATTPTGFFQSEVLRLYFLTLEPLFVWSVSLPSYFFQFIHTQIWDIQVHQLQPHPVLQPPPCCDSSRLGYLSLPLLMVLMGVSLTPWLLDFIQFNFLAVLVIFCFYICCSYFGCARRQSISTYT